MKHLQLFEDLFDRFLPGFKEFVVDSTLEEFRKELDSQLVKLSSRLRFTQLENSEYTYDVEDESGMYVIKFILESDWTRPSGISIPIRVFCRVDLDKKSLNAEYTGAYTVGGKKVSIVDFDLYYDSGFEFIHSDQVIHSMVELLEVVDYVLTYFKTHSRRFEMEHKMYISRNKFYKDNPDRIKDDIWNQRYND